MIFRSRKSRGGAAVAEPGEGLDPDQLAAEIEALSSANRDSRDAELERRILRLRHRLGAALLAAAGEPPEHPPPDYERLCDPAELPQVTPADLSAGVLRAGILRDGYLLIRGLVDRGEAERFALEIEHAFAARSSGSADSDGYFEEFTPDPPFAPPMARPWIEETGGLLAADSPRLLFGMLDMLRRAGLQRVIAEYLGETPALSLDKCTLRRASPEVPGAWHQDGAFMGEVRSLNVWLSLSHCGDEAPGLDIVPRRLDHLVETGTHGGGVNAVGQTVAERAAGDAGIVRPIFEPGDVMLFDELFLHSTASDPAMPKPRYAVESWFFGPAAFPGEYTPIAF